jgi:hypothetical protein
LARADALTLATATPTTTDVLSASEGGRAVTVNPTRGVNAGRGASGAGECPHRAARAGLTATGGWSGDRDGVSAVAGFVAGRRACACRFGGDAVNWANRAGATTVNASLISVLHAVGALIVGSAAE